MGEQRAFVEIGSSDVGHTGRATIRDRLAGRTSDNRAIDTSTTDDTGGCL